MDNMAKAISVHNQNLLKSEQPVPEKECNCQSKPNCPLQGKCVVKSVIYKATVKTNFETKDYIGLTENDFKSRYHNHTLSFRSPKHRLQTELSKYIWNLKDKGTDYTISWKIIKQARSYSNISKRCNLCLWEKYFIITSKSNSILNRRCELVSTCRHQRKFLLKHV